MLVGKRKQVLSSPVYLLCNPKHWEDLYLLDLYFILIVHTETTHIHTTVWGGGCYWVEKSMQALSRPPPPQKGNL